MWIADKYCQCFYDAVRSIIAERRKQAIVESKFLGGDIQHTHLVKGLDYVLLDKVSVPFWTPFDMVY